MSTVVVMTHFGLAVLLFFSVNWIGEHSSTFGYLQLSLSVRRDVSPAFNFVLKTLAPTAYIVLVATIFYLLHRDPFVRKIWLVTVYYFGFRLFYNILMSRASLLNWFSVAIQTTLGICASYVAYLHLILPRHPLFPGIESIGNQLWIIIALFIYATLNNVQTSTAGSARRKNRYVRSRFNNLREQYGSLIDGQMPERYMELVVYAVLIYETFNRPWLAQIVERAVFPWLSHTLGPMQVHTETRLSDRESVALGTQQLRELFGKTSDELVGKPRSRYEVIRLTLAKYNRDDSYIGEVYNLLHTLWAQVATDYRSEFETMHVPQSGV